MASYKHYEPLPPSEPTTLDNRNSNFNSHPNFNSNSSSSSYEEIEGGEEQTLLPSHNSPSRNHNEKPTCGKSNVFDRIESFKPVTTLIMGYAAGIVSVLVPLLLVRYCWTSSCETADISPYYGPHGTTSTSNSNIDKLALALPSFPADIGSTEIHHYPPPSPTNDIPSLFPTKIGFAGPTATGAEPGLVMTAGEGMYPVWGGMEGLVRPGVWGEEGEGDSRTSVAVGEVEGEGKQLPEWIEDDVKVEDIEGKGKGKKKKPPFDIFKHWGNLTPFHSVPPDSFGINSKSGPDVPDGCTLKGVHILHRHGARYPTDREYGAPGPLATKLHRHASSSPSSGGGGIKAHGPLSFLNTWTYKLGTETLTPFGRQQLFDLGVSMRMKYGGLLEGFTDRLPVLRTESQDRMLASATNFALGFFGWPLDDKFLLSVTVEEKGVNNTLAPYKTCPNDSNPAIGDRGTYYMKQWVGVYLRQAHMRIQALLEVVQLTLEDVYAMQMMCAYETTSLGYSKFCSLFTEEEWEGFEYALDLYFWYDSGFGSPVARALGSGYVLELLSRLTGKPISHTSPLTANPSTFSVNLTLDANPTTFPLDQPIYVDATHEVVIVNIVTALNLTSLFGEDEPPSWRRMKRGRRWFSSRVAPFAANMQLQLLECPDPSLQSHSSSTQIRIILNDGVVALAGVSGCPEQKDGLCPLDTFVSAQKKLIEGSDWDWTCHGNWTVPEGDAWRTVTGDPPAKP